MLEKTSFVPSGFDPAYAPALSNGRREGPWIGATAQLDISNPQLQHTAWVWRTKMPTLRGLAVALHDKVQSLPFKAIANPHQIAASDVLAQGAGDSYGKGMLLVALLRAVEIPARMRFLAMPVATTHGLSGWQRTPRIHAVVETEISGSWLRMDTHVFDTGYMDFARNRLRSEWRRSGYGLHLDGRSQWDGWTDAAATYSAADPQSLPVHDFGAFDDVRQFYSSSADAHDNAALAPWAQRLRCYRTNLAIRSLRARVPRPSQHEFEAPLLRFG